MQRTLIAGALAVVLGAACGIKAPPKPPLPAQPAPVSATPDAGCCTPRPP